jgi:hypothetical protein
MCIVFINIVERLFSDIFSTFVFNKIADVPSIFRSPRVLASPATSQRLTRFISTTYTVARFRQKTINPFRMKHIMESRRHNCLLT